MSYIVRRPVGSVKGSQNYCLQRPAAASSTVSGRPAPSRRTWRLLGLSPGLAGKRVVVQGLGNVGYHAAKFLREDGCTLVGLAEREGAIVREGGFDPDAVVAHRKATGSILGFPGATDIPESSMALDADCDILVPAALEEQITSENAHRIRARIVAEAANGPTTPWRSRLGAPTRRIWSTPASRRRWRPPTSRSARRRAGSAGM